MEKWTCKSMTKRFETKIIEAVIKLHDLSPII